MTRQKRRYLINYILKQDNVKPEIAEDNDTIFPEDEPTEYSWRRPSKVNEVGNVILSIQPICVRLKDNLKLYNINRYFWTKCLYI